MPWRFYGRQNELQDLRRIFSRKQWFFLKVEGRRRIGKSSLIMRATPEERAPTTFYMQVPDSNPGGVLTRFREAALTFDLARTFPDAREVVSPRNLLEMAQAIEMLLRHGWMVILDEFQYFNRKALFAFNSYLQESIDRLNQSSEAILGGLVVLGSLHTEMSALLEDKRAPLYARTTSVAYVDHLSPFAIGEILQDQGAYSPERFLFLWSLFEGVPKFYRDAYEQGVLHESRTKLLHGLFFSSTAPLRVEAENWFLAELRGRYNAVLQALAQSPMSDHGTLLQLASAGSGEDSTEQIASYLKTLIEKYRLVQRVLPVFSRPRSRGARYRISDNFLTAWLGALQANVHAIDYRPVEQLLANADERLCKLEGYAFERLVSGFLKERSRLGIGDLPVSRAIEGYWNKEKIEIDLILLDDESKTIRFGSCKRNEEKLLKDIGNFSNHVNRFLAEPRAKEFSSWRREYLLFCPRATEVARHFKLPDACFRVLDIDDLLRQRA